MTERQKLFCLEYLKDFNHARAYRAVYEGDVRLKRASDSAQRLLDRDDVRAYIASQDERFREEKIAASDEILAYFTSVMRGEIEMSARERNKAAEILAKRFALTDDFVSDGEGVVIVDDV